MLLSVIVPCFNVGKYLRECLNSILVNKSREYEIILVNDGSTDNTLKICEEYKSLDNNIKVISQVNSGVSIARNNGIKKSTGKYVMFVDGDDILNDNWGNLLNDTFLDDSSDDIIYFSERLNRDDTGREEIVKLICGYNKDKVCIGGPFSKLFKRKMLEGNDIIFDRRLINGEDIVFNLNAISSAEKTKIIPKSFYNYRQYQGSSTKKFDDRIIDNDIYFNRIIGGILEKCRIDEGLARQIEDFSIGSGILGVFSKISYLPFKKINDKVFLFLDNGFYRDFLEEKRFEVFGKNKRIALTMIGMRRYRDVVMLYKIKRLVSSNKKEKNSKQYKEWMQDEKDWSNNFS